MDSNTAVRNAIFTKLSTALTSLVGSRVYYQQAPTGATYPFAIFSKQSGTKTRAMGANAFQSQVWLVKGVDRNTSATTVEAIAAAIDTALDLGTITVAGKTLADLHHVSDVDYLETSGDQEYRHSGGNYRVVLT